MVATALVHVRAPIKYPSFQAECLNVYLKSHGLYTTFRCTNGYFHVALSSSMGLAFLIWVGGGLFCTFLVMSLV